MMSEEVNVAPLPAPSTSRSANTTRHPASEPARIARLRDKRGADNRPRRVALDDIDRSDMRFQYRLLASHNDLIDSLREQGQLNPVILWGDRPPFTIVDGFRRIDAISALGDKSVKAIFTTGQDETQVFAISFAENVRRKNLTPLDKANAIWRAINVWHMNKREVASALALSIRQIDRYLKLLELSAPLLEAVTDGRISMAHAILLHRASVSDASEWIDAIAAESLPLEEIKHRIRQTARQRKPRSYLVRDARGFRLRPVRYRSDMSAAEKKRIWDSLEAALKLIAESS